MEKLQHQEYRDELAGKLKEIRNSDPENPEVAKAKAEGYLEAKKETLEYKDSSHLHRVEKQDVVKNEKVIKDIEEEINQILLDGKNILLKDFSQKGLKINLGGENSDTAIFYLESANNEFLKNLSEGKLSYDYSLSLKELEQIKSLKDIQSVKITCGVRSKAYMVKSGYPRGDYWYKPPQGYIYRQSPDSRWAFVVEESKTD